MSRKSHKTLIVINKKLTKQPSRHQTPATRAGLNPPTPKVGKALDFSMFRYYGTLTRLAKE